ncbi:hypothetical protein K1X76_10605, partial [bacterium]|nr:hypothetical protein [bacterium]
MGTPKAQPVQQTSTDLPPSPAHADETTLDDLYDQFPPQSSDLTLNLFDMNTYGVFTAPDVKERMDGIRYAVDFDANGNGVPDADAVTMQEVFLRRPQRVVRDYVDSHFQRYIPSQLQGRVMPSGLAMMARYPILQQHFQNFPRCSTANWDWFANKGIAHIRFKHPTLGIIDLFTTHTQSAYDSTDQYSQQRIEQLRVIQTFIKAHSSPNHLTILTGDMNMVRDSAEYAQAQRLLPGFVDVIDEKYDHNPPYSYRRSNRYVCPDGNNEGCPNREEALDYIFV